MTLLIDEVTEFYNSNLKKTLHSCESLHRNIKSSITSNIKFLIYLDSINEYIFI